MDVSAKKLFDANASQYDRERKHLIPCFDDFYGIALSLVQSEKSRPCILDLGAGTGLFSSLVLHKYPEAQLTLIDFSEAMLEKAQQRFRGMNNVSYIIADYSDYSFESTYDIVISSLSIHHLTHEAKQRLFVKIYRLLRAGGLFVNADQVAGNHPQNDQYYRQRWLEAIHRSGLPQEAIKASVERRKLNINARVGDQIRWMEQAGFQEADCMYKYFDFAVFFGRKQEE
ncbi:class I SAM-dependent methyltransferase [Paenibacillus ginsengihumi]|uniref:class I SAM-dependent methyltransferase n=1 Tax=Paenibacillus ginsengihumi TaxID=431596 RepID=UPI000376B497|nr:class I SAM-dependent methyltransferase [Paenibacillus ginsengihumi]